MKAQSAVEMLTVYSWAVLLITILVAVALILVGSPTGTPSVPASCSIQPLFPCQDTVLTTYSPTYGILYYISFINDLQNPMLFPTNSFNLTTTGIGLIGQTSTFGNCYPTFALVGSTVICKVNLAGSYAPAVGTKVNAFFTITYKLCQSNSQSSCSASLYKSSGYSSQAVSTANVVLYSVSFIANEVNGFTGATIGSNAMIYMNGIPYAGAQNGLVVTTGTYNVFASIPSGFQFSSWSVNSPSTISSTGSLVSVLSLAGNAVLTVTSTNTVCYTCYPTAPTVCPSKCTTSPAQ